MRVKLAAFAAIVIVIFITIPLSTLGQSVQYLNKIVPDSGVAYDSLFGGSISMSPNGAFLAIGSSHDDIDGWITDAGSVSVFSRNNTQWSYHSKLTSPNRNSYVYFGSAVAVADDRLMVGAPLDNSQYGTVYVFVLKNNTWVYANSFSGSSWNTYLGGNLAIDGDLLLAGTFNPSGSLVAYTWNEGYWVDGFWTDGYWVNGYWSYWGWVEGYWVDGYWTDGYWTNGYYSYYTTLYGTYSYLYYRNSLDIGSAWVLAGSHGEVYGQGAAYVWPRSGNYIDQYSPFRLGANNPVDYVYLGYSAAIASDNTIALGCPGLSSIFIFSYTYSYGWSQSNILTAPSTISLGSNLAFSGSYLVAGDSSTQTAVIFKLSDTEWSAPYKIAVPSEVKPDGLFGNSVYIRGNEVFISDGAPYDQGYPAGAVFTFAANQALPSNGRFYHNIYGKSNNLGSSVSAEGTIVAIAQPACSEKSQYDKPCGKVYLVDSSSDEWRLVQYFQYLGRVAYSRFGTTVLVKNGWVLVTSQALYGSTSGIEESTVYGFRYSPSHGRYVRKFSVSSPLSQAYQYFGQSLAMDGNFTVISSPFANVGESQYKGRVYVFHYPRSLDKTNGPRSLEITCPSNENDIGFGSTVATSNRIIVVSTASAYGRLYVYSHKGITSAVLTQTITAELSGYSVLGYGLVFEGTSLFATSHDLSYPPTSGTVFHYLLDVENQFYEASRISPYDGDSTGYFGASIAYNSKKQYLVVGSSPYYGCTYCTGNVPTSVYVLQNVGGSWEQKKYSFGVQNGADSFGISVAANDDGITVGAPFDSVGGENRGAVYFVAV